METRNEFPFRVIVIGQDMVFILLTMFDKTYVKDIILILNYFKKEIEWFLEVAFWTFGVGK